MDLKERVPAEHVLPKDHVLRIIQGLIAGQLFRYAQLSTGSALQRVKNRVENLEHSYR
ncbi:hypothetical protein [Bradyrhizobium sp. CB3481]|uniref:hypothetical protein n=1 Tax=Bradyrhizobium sp. CB3481 TaxID=3039158 RepID=UPI0024B057EE|nr:hypothetical protein [Bradyrhizobium sp. CB3481]WFU18920.1 hypothetical protein QA643_11560 [Bradyrhizobium sp. CB3481]